MKWSGEWPTAGLGICRYRWGNARGMSDVLKIGAEVQTDARAPKGGILLRHDAHELPRTDRAP